MTKAAAGCRSFPGRTYGRIRSGGRGGGEGGRRSGGYKTSPLGYSPLRAPSLVRTCSARKADDPLTFLKRLLDWRLLLGLGSQSVYTFWRLIKLTPNYTGSSAALVAIDCRRISRH